jgi:hypothetical protein
MQTRRPGRNDLYLIPEDGVIDMIAVDIAASGIRPVRLTDRERMLAARRILAAGGMTATLMRRLRLTSLYQAQQFVARVNGSEPPAEDADPYDQAA